MVIRKSLAVAAGAALALQPAIAAALQTCLTEQEIGAIAIYSVPSVVQAVKLKCGSQLAANGYLARQGDAFAARYAALQPRVWPRAKSGLLKYLGAKSTDNRGRQTLDMVANLPDDAVRPLVDALIVQEVSAKIATGNCRRIELVMQAMSPIDPEIAGNLLGTIVGLVDPDEMPICPRRS
jgi:hypothetical protein